jgi:hypothetical protein
LFVTYLDESGDDGYPRYSSPLFVLTCAYLRDDQWRDTFDRLRAFRARLRANWGIPVKWELHAKYFILGKKPFTALGLSEAQRIQVVDEYCEEIAKSSLRVVNVVINKTKISTPRYEVLDRALNYLIQRVENDILRNRVPDNFIVITDPGRVGKMTSTSRKMVRHNYIPSQYGSYAYKQLLKRMLEDPLPKDSKESYFIQVADLVAYIVYMHKLLELGAGVLGGRVPAQINGAKLREWMVSLSPCLNLSASRYDPFGVVCYPR